MHLSLSEWIQSRDIVVVVQLLSHAQFFVTPQTAAGQALLSSAISRVWSVSCPLSQWCYPTISSSATLLLLLPSVFPSIRVFPNESALCISSVQLLSHVRLFATPWTAACQASLSITNSRSLTKLISIQLVMPSNHLILCRPLLVLPSILPSIRVFSNESVLCIRWPKD